MGELPHKVKELAEGAAVDLHRNVLFIEHDAVLIVVNIRRILQAPLFSVDHNRNHAVVLARRMVHAAGVAFIFIAEQALGIGCLLRIFRGGNRFRVLLRLRQVDRDVHVAVFGLRQPAHILRDPVPADIVGVLAELVVPVCRLPGILRIEGPELADDIGRTVCQRSHDLRVKQIPVGNGILLQAADGYAVIAEFIENLRQLVHDSLIRGIEIQNRFLRLLIQNIDTQYLQEMICRPDGVIFFNQFCSQPVLHQSGDRILYHKSPSYSNAG